MSAHFDSILLNAVPNIAQEERKRAMKVQDAADSIKRIKKAIQNHRQNISTIINENRKAQVASGIRVSGVLTFIDITVCSLTNIVLHRGILELQPVKLNKTK